MLTRIELTNFMSHAKTVIEPAAGLTVIVGPNNIGKSAIVAALQVLCHNDNSTYVMRHGEKECSVRVETDDGHVIQWRRRNSPSYIIDEQTFDRLRTGGLPDELHKALRLPKIVANNADFDVHFGMQKSPIFLLGDSQAAAARFFASSSDATRLVEMQKRHKEKLTEAQREKKSLEADSIRVNGELAMLEPVFDLEERLAATERAYDELGDLREQLDAATRHVQALVEQAAEVAGHAAEAKVLAALAPPPELAPLQPLQKLIDDLTRVQREREMAFSCAGVLEMLAAPPVLHDVAALAQIATNIAQQTRQVSLGEQQDKSFARLSTPPTLADTDALERHVERLAEAEQSRANAGERQTALQAVVPPPKLDDAAALQFLVSALERETKQATRWEQLRVQLASIAAPPLADDTTALTNIVTKLSEAETQAATCQSKLDSITTEFDAAANNLREQAQHATCHVCGGPLDPDRVLARAALGLGGDDHAH